MKATPCQLLSMGCVMLWVCVTASGTGNVARVEGRIDSTKYQQILEANITPWVKKPKLKRGMASGQQDNDPQLT